MVSKRSIPESSGSDFIGAAFASPRVQSGVDPDAHSTRSRASPVSLNAPLKRVFVTSAPRSLGGASDALPGGARLRGPRSPRARVPTATSDARRTGEARIDARGPQRPRPRDRSRRGGRRRAEGRRAEETSRASRRPVDAHARAAAPPRAPRARSRLVDALAVLAAGAFANRAGARGRTRATPREAARRKKHSPPSSRDALDALAKVSFRPAAAGDDPGGGDGAIAFDASLALPTRGPLAASPALVWSAVRRGALGELRAGVDLRDVLEQRRLLDDGGGGGGGGAFSSPDAATLARVARWRVGPARGVSSAVVAARAEDATRTVRFEMLSSADAAEQKSRLLLRGGDELGASNTVSSSSLLEEYRGTMGVEEGDGELRVYIRGVAVVNADAVPGGFGARRLARRVARAALGNQVRRTLGDVAGVAVLEKKRAEAEKI